MASSDDDKKPVTFDVKVTLTVEARRFIADNYKKKGLADRVLVQRYVTEIIVDELDIMLSNNF